MNESSDHTPDDSGASSTSSSQDGDEVQEELEDSLHELLENDSTDNKTKAARIIGMLAVRLNKGPIPSPETLQEYDNVQPGLKEKIIKAWEDQNDHRRSLEERFFTKNQARLDRAQHYALFLAIFGVLVAAYLAVVGASTVVAVFTLIVCIGGPHAALALTRSFNRNKEKE